MEKPRILYIVEAMGGGVFTYLVDLSNNLADKYDIHIAYAVRPQTPENFKSYFDTRINLIEVKNFGRSINPLKDVKAFFEIKKIAKLINPDIIHLHSSKAGALGRWAFNGRKTPMFYTPHGYSFLMQDQSKLKRLIYKYIEVICGRRNCTTISCSEGEHNESVKICKKATYVNNGINISELQSLMETIELSEKNEFTVFTLGRICYQKNPETFNKVALAMPDIKFIWIGDGELRNQLTAPNIVITGWVERKEALRYAMMSDVFVLTSLWEGLPISLLEAMYMKKLCVVSDVIGNHDAIHNRENGFVCNTVDDYIRAINLYKKGLIDYQIIESAFQNIMNIYNVGCMAGKYDEIYRMYVEQLV